MQNVSVTNIVSISYMSVSIREPSPRCQCWWIDWLNLKQRINHLVLFSNKPSRLWVQRRYTPVSWFYFLYISSFVSVGVFFYFKSFVVWSEHAACPWAETAVRRGYDSWQLCHPHQPVLPPQQYGGGAQPEEGNVSGTGYSHTHAYTQRLLCGQ